jgi:hypothetical protein
MRNLSERTATVLNRFFEVTPEPILELRLVSEMAYWRIL